MSGHNFLGLSRRRIAALVRVVWFLFLGGAGGKTAKGANMSVQGMQDHNLARSMKLRLEVS